MLLYRDGHYIRKNMYLKGVSKADIYEEMRLLLKRDNLDNIEAIFLEKNGAISFIEKKHSSILYADRPLL